MKQNIRVDIFSKRSCAYDFPEDPIEFIKWWQDKFDMCPSEYKDTLKVEVISTTCWDSPCLSVDIYYYRIESDDEYNVRLKAKEYREGRIIKRA